LKERGCIGSSLPVYRVMHGLEPRTPDAAVTCISGTLALMHGFSQEEGRCRRTGGPVVSSQGAHRLARGSAQLPRGGRVSCGAHRNESVGRSYACEKSRWFPEANTALSTDSMHNFFPCQGIGKQRTHRGDPLTRKEKVFQSWEGEHPIQTKHEIKNIANIC
jgi:hypothetical protein